MESPGIKPDCKEVSILLTFKLNREQKGMDSSEASSRRIRLLIPLGPAALPIGRDFSSFLFHWESAVSKSNQIGLCS